MPVRRWVNVAVALGCVVVLMTLIVCGIQRLREDARGSECRNKLKQFAIALANYHDANLALPPAYWSSSGWGWGGLLQPYLEGSRLYKDMGVGGRLGDWQHDSIRADAVRIVRWNDLCPSDELLVEHLPSSGRYHRSVHPKTAIRTSPNGPRLPIGPSNYIAIFGDLELTCVTPGTGLLWPNSSVSLISDVPDGLSATLMLGERDGSIHLAGNWAGTSYDENDPDACLDPQFVVDALVGSRPINGRDERCFSSRHPGGAHFLMADGVVKFISEKCSTTILRRLANRSDGTTVSEAEIPKVD